MPTDARADRADAYVFHVQLDEPLPTKHRFWLFAATDYYPSGGMSDFVGSYRSLKEATDHADSLVTRGSESGDDFAHVFDVEERRIVAVVKR